MMMTIRLILNVHNLNMNLDVFLADKVILREKLWQKSKCEMMDAMLKIVIRKMWLHISFLALLELANGPSFMAYF